MVYAQELAPERVGMISGPFFGFAFGMAGIGAAVLGRLADATARETSKILEAVQKVGLSRGDIL